MMLCHPYCQFPASISFVNMDTHTFTLNLDNAKARANPAGPAPMIVTRACSIVLRCKVQNWGTLMVIHSSDHIIYKLVLNGA